MNTLDLNQQVRDAHEKNDYDGLIALIPYAQLLGVECLRLGEDMVFRLPANKDLIGNPTLPAIHGGVIAALMDTAIIHWLFQHGIRAVTGDLRVRYLQPVACNIPLELIAWLVFPCPPLYHLKAELRAGGRPLARAEGKCMRREAI